MMFAARRQQGQALTEFLVAAFAIISLFLLIPLIAKYQDISSATQLASRYAAFDAITRNDSVNSWKPQAQLAAEVSRRFFSNPDAPIKTLDVAGTFKAHQNLFWRGPDDKPLIADLAKDVKLGFGPADSPTHEEGFSNASDGKPFGLHSQLDLAARGIYTANVSVKLANLPAGLRFYAPFDRLDLSLSRGTSVAIDPWTAFDPAQVESRISGKAAVFPTSSLAAISPAVDAAVRLVELPGGISGPRLGHLEFWRDVVPEDRLRSGS